MILFNEQIKENHVKLDIDIDGTITLFVDRTQVKQVLVNVILNALQAVKNKEEASVKIACSANSSDVLLEISDNGYGISAHHISRIFEPFFTTKNGGTGLGLFVSYRLVKENGGDILVQSREGFGTTLCLKFPVRIREVSLSV